MGPLEQILVENISLQRCNSNIFGLTVTVALFAKEAGFFQSGQVLSKTKSVTPHFFYISDITNSSSFNGKICRKKSMLENFRANVLKAPSNEETMLPKHCFRKCFLGTQTRKQLLRKQNVSEQIQKHFCFRNHDSAALFPRLWAPLKSLLY